MNIVGREEDNSIRKMLEALKAAEEGTQMVLVLLGNFRL